MTISGMRSFGWIVLLMMLLPVGCSGVRKMERPDTPVFTLSAIKAEPSKMARMEQILRAGGEVIVRVAAGDVLPFYMNLYLPVAEMASRCSKLRFRRDASVYLSAKGVLLSPDEKRWAKIDNIKAVQKLFSMKNGTMSVGFEATRKDGVFLHLSLQALEKR